MGFCGLLGLVFLRYAESHPLLGSARIIAVVAYFALYAVMVWKAETDYSS
jgi:hypothetical protein